MRMTGRHLRDGDGNGDEARIGIRSGSRCAAPGVGQDVMRPQNVAESRNRLRSLGPESPVTVTATSPVSVWGEGYVRNEGRCERRCAVAASRDRPTRRASQP